MTAPETPDLTEKRTTITQSISLDELLEKLVVGGVPVETYGTGNAKTIHHLLSEVNEGESVMFVDAKGTLTREVNVLWVDVLCELSNGDVYILKEDRQEFKDGRVKRRGIDSSIGEKLKPSETPEDAVERALQEELGVYETKSVNKIGYTERTFTPDTFPGIESTYRMHKYVSMIPESEFTPNGYVEYQSDKTNFYTWDLLHSSSVSS